MPDSPRHSPSTRKLLGFSTDSWKRVSREGTSVLLGQAGVAVIGLVGLRLITQLAEKSVFGQASLLLGAVTLGRNVFVAPVLNTQLRYHPQFSQRGELAEFTAAIRRLTTKSTLLFAAVGLLGYLAWRIATREPVEPLLAVALLTCLLAENLRSIPTNWLSAERHQGRAAAWGVLDQLGTLGLGALGLWLASGRSDSGATATYLSGQSLGSVLVSLVLARRWFLPSLRGAQSTKAHETEVLTLARSYGGPFIALALVSWLLNLGDRFVLGAIDNVDAVASYVAAYAIASRAVSMPQGVLAGFVRTILFQAQSAKDTVRAHRVFTLWLWASGLTGLAISGALWALGPWIAGLLLDQRYRDGAPDLMLGVGLGHALYGMVQVVENRIMSMGVSRSLIVPALLGGLINFAACATLIPAIGALGAAFAKVLAFGGNFLAALLTLRFVARMQIGEAS